MVDADAAIEVEEVRIDVDDDEANGDRFGVEGHFAATTPIDPLTEAVTLVFDGFTATLPAGSCVRDDDEGFECNLDLPEGGRVRADIKDDGEYPIRSQDITLSGIDLNSPVRFSLKIGNDLGETDIMFDGDDEFEALK